MNRTEKHMLERILIELENAVHDLISYVSRQTIVRMFDDPMADIDSFFRTRRENNDKR